VGDLGVIDQDGKLHITYEDQAEILRDLSQFGMDGESRAELRRAAREADAQAADPTHSRRPVVIHAVLGGRAWIPRHGKLNRLLNG
jgi:hypothetical protein